MILEDLARSWQDIQDVERWDAIEIVKIWWQNATICWLFDSAKKQQLYVFSIHFRYILPYRTTLLVFLLKKTRSNWELRCFNFVEFLLLFRCDSMHVKCNYHSQCEIFQV